MHVTVVQMPAVNTPQFSWARSGLPRHPQPVPPIYQPELAARGVVFAADHPRRRQYWVGGTTAATIVATRLAPALLDRYLARTGYRSQQTAQPAEPGRPDNLLQPVERDPRARSRVTWCLRRQVPPPQPAAVDLTARPRNLRVPRGGGGGGGFPGGKAGATPMTAMAADGRALQMARASYGVALLLQPGLVIRLATGRLPGQRACRVARLLGARHLAQATLTAVAPLPAVFGGGRAEGRPDGYCGGSGVRRRRAGRGCLTPWRDWPLEL